MILFLLILLAATEALTFARPVHAEPGQKPDAVKRPDGPWT